MCNRKKNIDTDNNTRTLYRQTYLLSSFLIV